MNSNKKAARIMVDVRIILSALWVARMCATRSRVSSCGNRKNGMPPDVLPSGPYPDMRRW